MTPPLPQPSDIKWTAAADAIVVTVVIFIRDVAKGGAKGRYTHPSLGTLLALCTPPFCPFNLTMLPCRYVPCTSNVLCVPKARVPLSSQGVCPLIAYLTSFLSVFFFSLFCPLISYLLPFDLTCKVTICPLYGTDVCPFRHPPHPEQTSGYVPTSMIVTRLLIGKHA